MCKNIQINKRIDKTYSFIIILFWFTYVKSNFLNYGFNSVGGKGWNRYLKGHFDQNTISWQLWLQRIINKIALFENSRNWFEV